MRAELLQITSHFLPIAKSLKRLEARNISMRAAMQVVSELQEHLETFPGELGDTIRTRLSTLLEKNLGYQTLSTIYRVLQNEKGQVPPLQYTIDELRHFQFAPLTSCDVERVFSRFEYILTDTRRGLSLETHQALLLVKFNSEG